MKRVLALLGVLLLAATGYACTKPAAAMTVREFATLPSAIDSLKVRATWSAATVPTPPAANGPLSYQVSWSRNSAVYRTVTVSGLADTSVVTPRASLGAFDTVRVAVTAIYQGRPGAAATFTKIFPGADARIPGTPVILQVDSL